MSDPDQAGKTGRVGIMVDDASGLRDFYTKVVGWESEDVSPGEYADYSTVMPASNEVVAGTCHARRRSDAAPRMIDRS